MRGKFGSTLGFILATSGAAIGLGNIQRFPYIVSEGGGAAFVFIYLCCVVLLGLPLILVEFSIGRHTQRNPVCAIDKLRPHSIYRGIGFLGIFTAFFILTYYSVVGGWAIGYVFRMLFDVKTDIHKFAKNPYNSLFYMVIFFSIIIFVVSRGIRKGIERYSKILMPILFFILLILVVRSLTLENSFKGVKYYLNPDFSEVNLRVILLALGQAFFSLCVGEAVLITYGSYASKKENLLSSASYIAIFDTLIAFLAGLIIFPALFSFGQEPTQGVGLTFAIFPKIFMKMPFGNIFGSLFFLLLSFAAITTGIALLEMPVIYLIDSRKWKRKKAVFVVGGVAFLLGIPSALSKGANSFLTNIHLKVIDQTGFYDIMDFIWGNLGMVMGGGLIAIFVAWVWGIENAAGELLVGCDKFYRVKKFWAFMVKYLIPIFIFFIVLSLFI
jgi:NSS family neurotransmitter:Na+ symporter